MVEFYGRIYSDQLSLIARSVKSWEMAGSGWRVIINTLSASALMFDSLFHTFRHFSSLLVIFRFYLTDFKTFSSFFVNEINDDSHIFVFRVYDDRLRHFSLF